jgi:hypothetical protein
MYRWELDGPAQQEFADLPPAARASLAAFMDAVVIVDPVQYQRRRDERDDVSMPLRSLHFSPDGGGRALVGRAAVTFCDGTRDRQG